MWRWGKGAEGKGRGQAVITLKQQMSPHEDDHAAVCAACTQTTSHEKKKIILLSGQKENEAALAWKLNLRRTHEEGQS